MIRRNSTQKSLLRSSISILGGWPPLASRLSGLHLRRTAGFSMLAASNAPDPSARAMIARPGSLRAERTLRPFELNVVIEMELVRVRAQPDGVDLLIPFVIQPRFDHGLGEDVAAWRERGAALDPHPPLAPRD